jgi:hypothetical protein
LSVTVSPNVFGSLFTLSPAPYQQKGRGKRWSPGSTDAVPTYDVWAARAVRLLVNRVPGGAEP